MALFKRTIFFIVFVWTIGCSIWAFLGVADFTIDFLPEWLPFPWTGAVDFIETPNGEVYVASKFFNKIVRYDQSGRFVALSEKYHTPSRHSPARTRLAVGQDGAIYVQTPDAIYTCSAEMEILSEEKSSKGNIFQNAWQLDPDGKPVVVTEAHDETVSNRAVRPGELLFGTQITLRERFECSDGSCLVRTENGLQKQSAEGRVLFQYGIPPVWMIPFAIPWPAFLAWPVFLGLLLLHIATRTRLRVTHSTAPHDMKLLAFGKGKYNQQNFIMVDENSAQETHLLFLPDLKTRIWVTLLRLFMSVMAFFPPVVMYLEIQKTHSDIGWLRYLFFLDVTGLFIMGTLWVLFLTVYWIGCEKITINTSMNRITFFDRLVLMKFPVLIEINYKKESSDLDKTQVEMTATVRKGGATYRNSKLYIIFNGRKVAISKNYSRRAREKTLEFLNQYLPTINNLKKDNN